MSEPDVSAGEPSTGEHEGHRLRHARGYGLVCVDENGDLCTHDPPQLDVSAVSGSRPVPEPATGPCGVCDGMGDVAVEFGETPLDYTTAPCSACGGSGVAATEGNQQ